MKYTKAKDTNLIHSLFNCDPEVSFHNYEMKELNWLESKFSHYYDNVQSMTREDAAKLQLWESYAANIQMDAERRYMESRYEGNLELLTSDAISIIEKKLVPSKFIPLFSKESLEDEKTLRNAVFRIVMIARMYLNYANDDEVTSAIKNHATKLINEMYGLNNEVMKGIIDEDFIWEVTDPKIGSYLRSSPSLNKLAEINTKSRRFAEFNKLSDTLQIERSGLTVLIEKYSDLKGEMKPSTSKVLDFIIIKYTESSGREPFIQFSLEEYMKICALTSRNKARIQLNNDISILFSMILTFKGKKTDSFDWARLRIMDLEGELKGGNIVIHLSQIFREKLETYPVMYLPNEIFKIKEKENPNAYYFMRKIAYHKYVNYFKSNANIISVKTIIESSPNIPKYEEIAKTGKINQRIITPFERDMNALKESIDWEYHYPSGDKLDQESRSLLDYEIFINLVVHIQWRKYPELTKKTRNKIPLQG